MKKLTNEMIKDFKLFLCKYYKAIYNGKRQYTPQANTKSRTFEAYKNKKPHNQYYVQFRRGRCPHRPEKNLKFQ